jgi:DNA processing protein
VWEDLPAEIRVALEGDESNAKEPASLFSGVAAPVGMGEHERIVFDRLRQDEALQLDDLMEGLDGVLGSPEVFTALFELELSGRVRQLPGKNYVRTI